MCDYLTTFLLFTAEDKIILDSAKDEKDESAANKEKDGESKEGEEDKDKEVLLIQDTGFNVVIQAPNIDSFDLPVSIRLNILFYLLC